MYQTKSDRLGDLLVSAGTFFVTIAVLGTCLWIR